MKQLMKQLIKLFKKPLKIMKTQTIKREYLKIIYDAVCDTWKNKIAEVILWNNDSLIKVDEALILEGYSQADDKQKRLLEKYFKIPAQINMNSLNSYEDACKITGKRVRKKNEFEEESEWIEHQLKRWIEAANFIDNGGKPCKLDFTDSSEDKYLPYFQRTKSGWSLLIVDFYRYGSYCSVGYYFKKENTAKIIVERCMSLYSKWLG